MISYSSHTLSELQRFNPGLVEGAVDFNRNLIVAANRMANNWPHNNTRVAGYPTWNRDAAGKWEIMRFIHTGWLDVSTSLMRAQTNPPEFNENDHLELRTWARALNRCADRGVIGTPTNLNQPGNPPFSHGVRFPGGAKAAFMTGEIGPSVRGANCLFQHLFIAPRPAPLPSGFTFWDFREADLVAMKCGFVAGIENEFGVWTKAISNLSRHHGYRGAIPNYEIGLGRVHGAYVF